MEETKEELEEFQISSRELELELEAQLEQLETKNKDNESQKNKFMTENEALRVSIIQKVILLHTKITGCGMIANETTRLSNKQNPYCKLHGHT